MFPLEIFPESSLAQSVVTTVWIGVFVVCFFNLRFGWTFSGLVVPGYLVPLMIAKPASACVVCLEGILTYLLVRFLSSRFLESGKWSSFFGRDRFFALIVASLLVRLVLDGLLLPKVGELVNRSLGLSFDYRNHLSSFGLIIVALIGNQFWKTGLARGLLPFATTLGGTYLIVRFGLMELTNFNIGNLEYMYENISTSLVASPKAYIVLLTAGLIASRLNLLYGWDFNGILIPSLLALQWYQPLKIFTTFGEAFIILGLGSLVLRAPCFQRVTIEGARKLLLFFNISFAYKLALGFAEQWSHATFSFTDLFGYGYLIPTLIAVKMHDKHVPIRFTRATLQASFTGAVVASVVGFSLTYLPQDWMLTGARADVEAMAAEQEEAKDLLACLRRDKVSLYKHRRRGGFDVPLPAETDSFRRALREIESYRATGSPEVLERARLQLDRIGYRADRVEGRYLYLRESGEARGWGIYVLDRERRDGPTIEVPAPVDEWAVLEAGYSLFDRFGGGALAIAGSSRRASRDGAADVLTSSRTLYCTFHRIEGRADVIQVRGFGAESLARAGGNAAAGARRPGPPGNRPGDGEPPSAVWIHNRIPRAFDLVGLERAIGPFRVEWGRTPLPNLQRDETAGAFAELVLNRRQRKKLLALSVVQDAASGRRSGVRRVKAPLGELLRRTAGDFCPRGSERYVAARMEEILYFDQEVLTPLHELLRERGERLGGEGAQAEEETAWSDLEVVAATAATFEYRVTFLQEPAGGRFVVLAEDPEAESRRYWGTFAFRLAERERYCVEVPRPGLERDTLDYGLLLFDRLRASELIVSGSHPLANRDGSSDVALGGAERSIFQLAHQVAVRERAGPELAVVQVRAFGVRPDTPPPGEDALISLANGCVERRCFPPLVRGLVRSLESDRVTVGVVAGGRSSAGYEAYDSPQARYPRLHDGVEFCLLWLSPWFRMAQKGGDEEDSEERRFELAGVPTGSGALWEQLNAADADAAFDGVSSDVLETVEQYVDTRDPVLIQRLSFLAGVRRVERFIDDRSGKPFLLVWPRSGPPVVFQLGPYRKPEVVVLSRRRVDRESVARFTRSLAARLEVRDEP